MMLRLVLPMLVFALAVAASIGPSTAATGGTIVGATVPSATHVDDDGCPPLEPGITDFGSVLPGGPGAVTSGDCIVEFGSSNDTATLRIGQEDLDGHAMYAGDTGDLDTSWGTDGWARIATPTSEYAHTIDRQSDGKLIIAGTANEPDDAYIARVNADGTLDTSFASPAGYRIFEFAAGQSNEWIADIHIAADDSITAVGASNGRLAIARFDADGGFDGTLAGDGTLRFDIPGAVNEDGTAVTVLDDGRIIVGAETSLQSMLLGFTAAGVLDTTGFVAPAGLDTSMAGDSVGDIEVDADGMIVYSLAAGGADTVVERRHPDGDYDLAFNGTGTTSVPDSGFVPGAIFAHAHDVEIAPDGKIVVASEVMDTANVLGVGVARYEADGDPDLTFAGDGSAYLGTGVDMWLRAGSVSVRADGSVRVSVPRRPNCCDAAIALVGFTEAGVLDPDYGTGGWIEHNPMLIDYGFATANVAIGMLPLGDGAFVVVGGAWGGVSGFDPIVYRVGGEAVSQYESSGDGDDTDWASGAATNMFGACLVDVSAGAGTTVDTWTEDVDTDCADGDADPWNAIPASTSDPDAIVASAPSTDDDARAHLRFGFRTRADQPPGAYRAPIVFEVVAPG